MQSIEPKHILIVDDSSEQRFLLKSILEAKGYTTDCTPNGEEALVLLRSKKRMPQTILLDLNMEIMDGFEFRLQQIADPLLRDIPVIVVSGVDDMNSVRAIVNSEVISKPLNISLLLSAVEKSSRLH